MDMPLDSEMLRERRMNDAIRSAYEAGKSVERFFDRRGSGRTAPEKSWQGKEDFDRADIPGWHH